MNKEQRTNLCVIIIGIIITIIIIYLLEGCTLIPRTIEEPTPIAVEEEITIKPQIMRGFQKDRKARKEAFTKLTRTYPDPRLHVSGYTIYDEKGQPIDITVETYYFNIDADYFAVVRKVNGKILYMDTIKKQKVDR